MTLFRTVLADPPWSYHGGGKASRYLQHRQYKSMKTADIAALPVASVCAPDAVLLLWCTWPKLADGMEVMKAWDFRQVSGFPWVKLQRKNGTVRMGPGYHVRQCSEFVLIGIRGAARAPEPEDRLLGLIMSPIGRHSEKPEEQYRYAERYPGPWLELFARNRDGLFTGREGWTRLGDDVTGRDIYDDLKNLTAIS